MLAYSPCDTEPPPGDWPALLVTGAVHDARVLIHEPAIWVARLRHANPTWTGCLFRPELGAGSHDGPSYADAALARQAELAAWLIHHLGLSE